MLQDIIMDYGGVEVSAMEVYSDIFRLGTNEIQKSGEPHGDLKANPLGYGLNHGEEHGRYRIMLDDTFEETLKELQECDFAIMNGITYFGRKNTQEHASKMYALIIDLDGITDKSLNNFFFGAINEDFNIYPLPNYTILSGSGVHLYYVFEEPVSLFPNIKLQLKELKYALTQRIWNKNTTELYEKVQFQGINQGFRVIGGKTKLSGVIVRAFRTNQHPFSINQLNEYVPEDKRLDQEKIWKESKLTLAMAKKKYPLWYEKRVLKNEPKGTWTCKSDLYYWWIRKIKGGAVFGHRYFCIMVLSIYAIKSGILREQLEEDARLLLPFLNSLNTEEPFTESDMFSAMECYDERYKTFPIDDIVKLTAIPIQKNKRNGRTRQQQIKIVNATNLVKRELGEQIGRPSKEEFVKSYIAENPTATVTEIAKKIGVSRPTVYKYMGE